MLWNKHFLQQKENKKTAKMPRNQIAQAAVRRARARRQLTTVGHGVLIKRSRTGHGNGLFAARTFHRGDWITRYSGKLVRYREAMEEKRRNRASASHMRSHIAMTWVLDGLRFADGRPVGTNPATSMLGRGGGAFANDARGTRFRNNVAYDFYDLHTQSADPFNLQPGKRITFIRATRLIRPGDEILVNYGERYWQ
jgi:hypothetical protein